MTRRGTVPATLVLTGGLIAACAGAPTGATPSTTTLPTPTLDGLRFGYAVASDVVDDPVATAIVERDATVVTPENAFKWENLQPERGVFDFEEADRIVAAAQEAGVDVRGHVLVWHRQLPEWLEQGDWSADELTEILVDHITTVVGHFRDEFPGVVTDWDVVNEAIGPDGRRRPNLWQETIGDDYLDLAFTTASDADPDVTLWYNDYVDDDIVGVTPDRVDDDGCAAAKCLGIRLLVTDLVERGVPIDGVGFQGHVLDLEPPDYGAAAAWTGPLGLRWALTEVDVAVPADLDGDPATLDRQADAYVSMVEQCATAPNCDTVVVWGVTDARSWIPDRSDGELGSALLYDADGDPKPVRDLVLDAVDRSR